MGEPTKFPHIFAVNIDDLKSVRRDADHKWGYEVWLVNDEELNLCCKLLVIFPGWLSSKHSHETKDEYFIVQAGELKLHVWKEGEDNAPEMVVLPQGEQHFIPHNTYHRFETGTRQFVLLLEVSTYEDEQTDKLLPSERLY